MNERVTVTGPRRRRPRVRRQAVTAEIDAQTRLGEIYMRALLRAQLRLGLTVAGVVFVMVAMVPLVFAIAPGLKSVDLMGIPLPWVLLGGAVYPVLIVAAWFYLRHAERIERDFAEMVNRR
ncbi:hypothetical protein [Phytoactinopolyspora halotolerans]|uniref:DUF485 domain-containing protein n=1 Tax=Phytoactinopolyspora halotolerans TaxID=1981512 RepID=A0A6L9S3Y2_9ACTN|nr:hypothetical protein [Phytoactinopolyspora halotolerans]NED99147.1 hypothetical protein [Phytoactinopolyspora halotolerans]